MLNPPSSFIAQTNIYSNFTPRWYFLNCATATYSQVKGGWLPRPGYNYHGRWLRGQHGHIFLEVLGWPLWFTAWCNHAGLPWNVSATAFNLYIVRCGNPSSSHHNVITSGRRRDSSFNQSHTLHSRDAGALVIPWSLPQNMSAVLLKFPLVLVYFDVLLFVVNYQYHFCSWNIFLCRLNRFVSPISL